MKRKILIGLGIITVIFFCGSGYIIYAIDSSTSRLDNMIMLHQVEILREHYLIQIKRVQADLLLKDTRYPRSFDIFVKDILSMGKIIHTCYDCHHNRKIANRINILNKRTDDYKNALSRVLTIRANTARLSLEKDHAFRVGEALTTEVRDMIEMTRANLEKKREKSLQDIAKTKYILYFLIGIIPLLSGTLAYIVLKGITNPMERLLDSTRRLKSGDLDHRIEGLKHEFGELAVAFNEMASSLKDQMLKMQRTEQMVVVAQLAAGLAHEIKNPLAGIKVAMHVLSEEASLSEEDRAVLGKVIEEITRLDSLMKNFLNFAKPPKPTLSPLNVNELLHATLAFYTNSDANHPGKSDGIRIEKDFRSVPQTMADLMQLQQVFLNIVLNAIDAMPKGGTLTIRTSFSEESGRIRVEIADTGKGIGEGPTEKIFEPFFTTKPKGTGLGLAISKQLVEQHGGSIAAANNPGGGATFEILLPRISPEEDVSA
ncbi:MAG TPA: ATP-binding protein [Candidatus Limnocylindria bacterium]|nr:ATP-binding protein [Candidatus Limnocylindria bacterium]